MTVESRSTSDPRPARTRAAILAAAAEVIAEDGIDGARMAVIAKRAGVGVSSMYVHFESKSELVEALIAAALRRGDEQSGRPVLGRTEHGKATGLAADLMDLAFAEPVAMRAMAVSAMDSGAVAGVGARFLEARRDAIETAISDSIDSASPSEIQSNVAATMLFGLALGLSDWALRRDDFVLAEGDAREAFALGASLLLGALAGEARAADR